MKPEDVPAELLEAARRAELHYDPAARSVAWGHYQRALLAAVLPEHERIVREQVAAEIEQVQAAEDDGSSWGGGMLRAIEIARGGQ